MGLDLTLEQKEAIEAEFKAFLADRDNMLSSYHNALNIGLALLPEKGMITYTNDGEKVRGELVGADDKTFYTWWTSEDILGFSIIGAVTGMFQIPGSLQRANLYVLAGIDLREKFIDMVNLSIETLQELYKEWEEV